MLKNIINLLFYFVCAFPVVAAASEMQPIQVARNSYYVQGAAELGTTLNQNFISNAGFVIGKQCVVVIDALGSPALANQLIHEIKKLTDKPIAYVILTHYHADHIYGLQSFSAMGTTVLAQELGREYLTSDTAAQRLIASRDELSPWIDNNTRLIAADTWIDKDETIKLCGLSFELMQVGPAHTPDDLAIFIPSEKVLFAGDLVFNGRIPFVGSADSRGWIKSLNKLDSFDADVIVPGHGLYSDHPKQDLIFTREYLIFLRQAMQQAAIDLEDFDQAYLKTDWSLYKNIPLFNAANRMNAYNVYLSIQNE